MLNIFPDRLTTWPGPDRDNRKFLQQGDSIFYFVDYTIGSSYDDDPVSSYITNFKKCPERFPTSHPARKYKEQAIELAITALNRYDFAPYTLVPLPPSKSPDHPAYDDRIARVLNGLRQEIDVRPLIVATSSRQALHSSDDLRDPQVLRSHWRLDESLLQTPVKSSVIIFDDVLASGCHFRAASELLKEHIDSEIGGLFLARAVYPRPEDAVPLNFNPADWGI